MKTLYEIGETDAAWIAADRARFCAEAAGSPLAVAASIFVEQADGVGLVRCRSRVPGRWIRVTVNALTTMVVTIAPCPLWGRLSGHGGMALRASSHFIPNGRFWDATEPPLS
jgi:hypothetical protein